MKLLRETLVSGSGHDGIFIQAGEDTDWVGQLDEVDGWLQIPAEVDELPLDLFSRVLLLFQNEHVVVEELL